VTRLARGCVVSIDDHGVILRIVPKSILEGTFVDGAQLLNTEITIIDIAKCAGRFLPMRKLKDQMRDDGVRKFDSAKKRSSFPGKQPAVVWWNAEGILEAIDNEEIVVIDNGKRKRMAKAEIEFRQLFTKATKGDLRAARLILSTATKYFSPEAKGDCEYEFIGVTEAAQRFGRNWSKLASDKLHDGVAGLIALSGCERSLMRNDGLRCFI